MRPIDADKLKAKQQEDADLFIGDDTLSGKSRRDEALNAVANIVNAPTIDAVPVVRCKDCIHNSLNRRSGNAYCEFGFGLYQLNDFCSWGERREDGHTEQ